MQTLSEKPAALSGILLKQRIRQTRWFALPFFLLLPFSSGFLARNEALHESLEWLGLVCLAVCVLGRAYCSLFIGGRKNDTVIDTGVFSVVRNPLYVFSFIGLIGIGLYSLIFSFMLFLIVAFGFYYTKVVAKEEQYLTAKFGAAYREYIQTVPRWLPDFKLWRQPEYVEVKPQFVLLTMRDGITFFLAPAFFEAIELLQHSGVLPILIRLP